MLPYPTGVEIVINLTNPMVRDWTILSNSSISLYTNSYLEVKPLFKKEIKHFL
jgi:hypothetical protein